jgi:hypothetical protein
MPNIHRDIEEYDGQHCSPADNGFDDPVFDNEDCEYTAEQTGLKIVKVGVA